MATKRRGGTTTRRNPISEQVFETHGVEWEYLEKVSLETIVKDLDAQSRQRNTPPPAKVNEYAEAYKGGADMPPLVLWEDGEPGYTLLDGNTRRDALVKLGRTDTNAYLVKDLKDGKAEAVYISGLFNARQGMPLDKAEIKRAVLSAKKLTVPVSDAALARDFGMKASAIHRLVKASEFDPRAERLGLTPNGIPESSKARLTSLADDSVFGEMTKIITDAHLTTGETGVLLKEVNSKGSEAERLAVITQERQERAEQIANHAKGREASSPPATESLLPLGKLWSLMEKYPNPEDWVPGNEDKRQQWHPIVEGIAQHLDKVAEAYEDRGL